MNIQRKKGAISQEFLKEDERKKDEDEYWKNVQNETQNEDINKK